MKNWVSAFRSGESEVLEAVYLAHVALVRRWLRANVRRTGRLSPVTVDDILQETFARAFSPQARARYDASRSFAPYLLTIARNCLIDWLRQANDLPALGPDLDERLDGEQAARTQQPPSFSPELLLTTSRFLSSLPAELHRVYLQRYELDESQQRAAEALGISRQNLRTLERKLLTRLRRELCRAGLSTANSRTLRSARAFDGDPRRERLPVRDPIESRIEVFSGA